ncbi:hypothetical protein MNBD_GAMMA15-258 [hydrothermal vent metagenome]|uniref:Uncharacterized protein n=1 Tax=hydrothermal vent metagenome TaxID=652676 RepID=A0A3B0YP25_9ZZZZ
MWLDMAGKDTEHQQGKQGDRQANTHCQCFGCAFRPASVLEHEQHAAAKADNDGNKHDDDKSLD